MLDPLDSPDLVRTDDAAEGDLARRRPRAPLSGRCRPFADVRDRPTWRSSRLLVPRRLRRDVHGRAGRGPARAGDRRHQQRRPDGAGDPARAARRFRHYAARGCRRCGHAGARATDEPRTLRSAHDRARALRRHPPRRPAGRHGGRAAETRGPHRDHGRVHPSRRIAAAATRRPWSPTSRAISSAAATRRSCTSTAPTRGAITLYEKLGSSSAARCASLCSAARHERQGAQRGDERTPEALLEGHPSRAWPMLGRRGARREVRPQHAEEISPSVK